MDAKTASLEVVPCPNGDVVSAVPTSTVPFSISEATLGRHLARCLVQIGVSDVFSVPDDFNLTLLDLFIAEPGLNLICCCNELNVGYAADGYARSHGVGACVVTFDVGGLSVLNAIAGAYSENLPLICIAVVKHLEDAHEFIDIAISTALKESKPVYISICCNLIPHPTFNREPVPFTLSPTLSNEMGLEAAIEAAAEFLNKAVKPVMVGGPKLRVANACKAFMELANSSDYVFAVMPSGKGLVPEHHPHFIGTYWGSVSTSFCAEIIESTDAYLFVGPIFNDFNSVGYSLSLSIRKRQSFCSLIEL
ncbi:hypothetical protein SSX86_000014 [Deinandra increscens subsp. villosa]|uniref:pyruvate decarboxylase n=1 Tax=Deinandra increscens subsp. villosa TaxID=3103831 RepID=A0AAP0DXB5_9ASTR